MGSDTETITLVRQAQQGHPEARRDLAKIVEARLLEYVGRLTLDRDLTADIVQESIAEMLKILNTLKDPQRFWCWLYTITLNKVRAHYRRHWRRKGTSLSDVKQDWLEADHQDVLAELVTEELKQIVVRAICELEPRQRAVLTMRCYDQMSYAEISETMGCTQLGARALFHRAKKTLGRLLSSHGIDKSALPVALLFFGKLSARSQAAVAGVSIAASTLQVGPWAPLVALAAKPVTVVILLVAAIIWAGGILMTGSGVRSEAIEPPTAPAPVPLALAVSQDTSCWYYYPPGTADTVMIRTRDQTIAYGQWLQKEQANYYRDGDTIHIRNHRQFAPDLAVWRLPTDPPALQRFLDRQDGHDPGLKYVAPSSRGLLVAVEQVQAAQRRQVTLSYDVSMEDYFRHDWSTDAAIVDERDDTHRRGWTYFTVAGRMGAQPVSGYGQLPFVASEVADHGPRLRLTITNDLTVLDAGAGAELRDKSGATLARYTGGSFFQGLGRPWSGLHAIDTIRRDAALAGVTFTTRTLPDGQCAEIVLNGPHAKLTYRVHLYQDWIESITFSKEGATIGEWTFSYPVPDEADPHRLTIPSSPQGRRTQTTLPHGLWLLRLAQGSLAQP